MSPFLERKPVSDHAVRSSHARRALLGLLWLGVWIQLSRGQCVLEKEYFCSSIPDGFPEGLTSIVFVVTNLGVINSTVFRNPTLTSVTSLALANSGITKIEPGAFHVFQSLTKLSLYQNGLTHLSGSWLSNPGLLENLTLAQNLISRIGRDTFSGFSNLTTLSVANNRIRQIDRGSFKDLAKLKWLDLSGNNLTVLTRSAFEGLVTPPAMKLGGNPWNCSCELQDLGLFLYELINASLLDDVSSVVCHSPPSLQGIPVWNVSDFNCPPDVLSPPLENSFYSVGLPALLASLAFVSFLACLCCVRMAKREKKQIWPNKEAVDSTMNAKPNGQVDPTAEGQQTEGKPRTSEMGAASRTRRRKVRARSASAILLRREFHQTKWRTTNLVETKWDHGTVPYVSLSDKLQGRRNDDLNNLTAPWDLRNAEEGHGRHSQGPDETSSIPGEGSVETSRVEGPSEAARNFLQDDGISEALDKDNNANDLSSVENPELLLYLTVARAPRQPAEAEPQEDTMTRADESPKVSLKRALTWPYERGIGNQRLDVLNARGPFEFPFHLNEMGKPREESGEGWLCMAPKRKDQLLGDWRHELRLKLLNGKESLHQKEPQLTVEEATGVGEGKFKEGQPRHHGRTCLGLHDQIDQGDTQINMEPNPTRPPEVMLQRESNTAAVARCVHTSPLGIKPTRHLTSVKAKQGPKPVSSQSRSPREVPPSPTSSVDISATSSAYNDDASLECYDYNYMNLLHEVVENRGRWTRERWKQTHRNGALRKSK